MMKIYKVEVEKLTFDMGRHCGWKLIGHFTNEEKAKRIARDYHINRNAVVEGDVRITEIEVDDEE